MDLTNRTILVTGGTSGIGRALAERFHALGNRVIVAGRRQALLDELTAAHPGMSGLAVDVADPAALDAFAAEVLARFPDLDMLVNNAGISRTEDLRQPDFAVARAIIDTNLTSVVQLTAALLPALQRRPRATIMTMTSGLAFVPRAAYPTYCASKAFLHSWCESLRHQLRGGPVEVLELLPPYVQTELSGASQATDPLAMPLAEYVDEVLARLPEPTPPHGEIRVQRVQGLREAAARGDYAATFAALNSR